ncbi:hypothetical protein A4A49_00050 [Nicotiana attenuata]|uniref:Uncharacterized protein n=1 Tax=Nicotiana attenuata TaxID=49451 RepID=A0A1J6IEB5_NICAT|nr:hypothetical protein A4A49_00050 [Nicotiana attenuata]
MVKAVATTNLLLLKTIFLVCFIIILTQAGGIERREIESIQAYASTPAKVNEMEKYTINDQDDSIVIIDYTPSHGSPDIHHHLPPPKNRYFI